MALTPKQRQANRRAAMAAQGKKQLALGFVDERLHEPVKRVVAQLESGEVELTNKGEIARPMRDQREEDKLRNERDKARAEVERLKVELGKAQAAFKVQKQNATEAHTVREKAIKAGEQWKAKAEKLESELGRFESVFLGFYRKK